MCTLVACRTYMIGDMIGLIDRIVYIYILVADEKTCREWESGVDDRDAVLLVCSNLRHMYKYDAAPDVLAAT